jgi:hypothetical protein
MVAPLVTQATALLQKILEHQLPASCSLEQIEQLAHQRAQEVARTAVECLAQQRAEHAEAVPLPCPCGGTPLAQQHRRRRVLTLSGLIRVFVRRYHCPACGTWHAPGAAALQLRSQQRMTRTVGALLGEYGSAWSFAVAARRIAQVLPGVDVSAKTVERCVKRCATAVAAAEDAAAEAVLQEERSVDVIGPAFAHPHRVFIALDGILVRGRQVKQRIEIQVGSLWSHCREIPGRKHPRREITDRTMVARAQGWSALGRQVWRVFVQRGGAVSGDTQVVVLGDGASGIRSLWELHFADALALLDPWHLWEKVKQRSREVLGRGEASFAACQEVWAELKVGAVERALKLVRPWSAQSEWARGQRDRLVAYLERNRDLIRDYEALRQAGYHVGAGLCEKQNDLVVAPRMKNGKMHWSTAGANRIALLRARLINAPDVVLPI